METRGAARARFRKPVGNGGPGARLSEAERLLDDHHGDCPFYTSDAADDLPRVALRGRRSNK